MEKTMKSKCVAKFSKDGSKWYCTKKETRILPSELTSCDLLNCPGRELTPEEDEQRLLDLESRVMEETLERKKKEGDKKDPLYELRDRIAQINKCDFKRSTDGDHWYCKKNMDLKMSFEDRYCYYDDCPGRKSTYEEDVEERERLEAREKERKKRQVELEKQEEKERLAKEAEVEKQRIAKEMELAEVEKQRIAKDKREAQLARKRELERLRKQRIKQEKQEALKEKVLSPEEEALKKRELRLAKKREYYRKTKGVSITPRIELTPEEKRERRLAQNRESERKRREARKLLKEQELKKKEEDQRELERKEKDPKIVSKKIDPTLEEIKLLEAEAEKLEKKAKELRDKANKLKGGNVEELIPCAWKNCKNMFQPDVAKKKRFCSSKCRMNENSVLYKQRKAQLK
jgi:hypothetical protein